MDAFTKAREIAAKHDLTDAQRQALAWALSEIDHTNKELVRQATGIIRDMERLVENIDNGMNVNENGELQSSGPKLDMLCAKRQLAYRSLTVLANMMDLDVAEILGEVSK